MAGTKQTICVTIHSENPDESSIQEAGRILREGGLVAFPTETVYGLGANALDETAVGKIFTAKGRPSDNPLIVHIDNVDQVYDIADDITVQGQRLMEVFWPGPLTIILPKKSGVSSLVTAGLDTVAVRMPEHKVALSLIKAAGVPVAAPSANTSGKPSPTTAEHVINDLKGKVDMIVDGGPCRVGLESTVLDLTCEPPVILRPGGITREDLEGVIGHVEVDPGIGNNPDFVPRSPGMKYTHYSPEAEVVVVTGEEKRIPAKVIELISEYRSRGLKIGILASQENITAYDADEVFNLGSRSEPENVARNLFKGLRLLDEKRVDIILAEGVPEKGVGLAVMNRLSKAAGYNILVV